MDPQQVVTIFADIQATLEALTQIMNQNRDKLDRVEMRIENHNKREGKLDR